MKFEDTKLMRNPLVEKAFETFSDKDGVFIASAIKGVTIIVEKAEKPDPEAVAAGLLHRSTNWGETFDAVAKDFSPGTAKCLEEFYMLQRAFHAFGSATSSQARDVAHRDMEDIFRNEKVQQVFLGDAAAGFRDLRTMTIRGGVPLKIVQDTLHATEEALRILLPQAADKEFARMVAEKHFALHSVYQDRIGDIREQAQFENSGLSSISNHPTVRTAYEIMKDAALKDDPEGLQIPFLVRTARILVETKASSDPDVLAAALLTQYTVPDNMVVPNTGRPDHSPPPPGMTPEQEIATERVKRTARFLRSYMPDRVGDLYTASAFSFPFSTASRTEEGRLIAFAKGVSVLEQSTEEFQNRPTIIELSGAGEGKKLQALSNWRDMATSAMNRESVPEELKSRAQEAITTANALLNEPVNKITRAVSAQARQR